MTRPAAETRKTVLIITAGEERGSESLSFLGADITAHVRGCRRDVRRARALIAEFDGNVDAVALELPVTLSFGRARVTHDQTSELLSAAKTTPVVDGSGVRDAIQRWAIVLADRNEPGIFADKHVVMMPGLNHSGLAASLMRHSQHLNYADPLLFFGLPRFPWMTGKTTLDQAALPILENLKDDDFRQLMPAEDEGDGNLAHHWVGRADVLAGDAHTIARFGPRNLRGKTLVADFVADSELEDFRARGASIVVTTLPPLVAGAQLARHSAAVVEAVLVALRPRIEMELTEDTYLDLIADLDWTPGIRYLQSNEAGINRFAFVIHPLSVRMITAHPYFRWARIFPDSLVESIAAYMPPFFISKVTGAISPATGQKVEGYLYTLGATPRKMMQRGERSTYNKLRKIAGLAQKKRARIMGLGAFTSVVGDAGRTVAHETDIAITSGNSLTVSATLEAAKQAVLSMGADDLTRGRAMIVGATGSIGAVCARLIAQAVRDVVLVSIEPERLIELKRRIQHETPGARVVIGTHSRELLTECDLVVTATSAFGQRVVDISQCKPGAVVCDVARPHDISPEEAATRPDVLVIDSGEVLIPGDIDFGYDIGLPPGISYACLAETCLLAMDGRFEDYTIGREIHMQKVKEIYRLFKKHGFQIAGLHSFDEDVTEEVLAGKRALAARLRSDPEAFRAVRERAAEAISRIPVAAKGVRKRRRHGPWLPRSWLRSLLGYFDRRQGSRAS